MNSFQVDPTTGLPNPANYNATDVKNDQGVRSADPFIPEAGTLDARLDWTVGRRGIPYLDWGKHPGFNWIRDQSYGGPYSPIKNTYYNSQTGVRTDRAFWTSGITANNYTLIRYADVILMAAECEVEGGGSLERARALVNAVRARAADPTGFVLDGAAPAANYKVGLYTTPWTSQADARAAVRFERKLELGMEGHRFFDLVRWGVAATELNRILDYNGGVGTPAPLNRRPYLTSANFTANKNEYFPIPQGAIDRSVGSDGVAKLKQNPGY